MNDNINEILIRYADKYENTEFLSADASWFMHQVSGDRNQETLAFIASCPSYGSRKQFFPKIQYVLDCSRGDVYEWVKSGRFEHDIPADDECYYRLYTNNMMRGFIAALRDLLSESGSIRDFIQRNSTDGYTAVAAFCAYFHGKGVEVIVPKNTSSACKRVCMFLRWMVRDGSPVDLGLWSDMIDKRTLIMPLDTHVLSEACKLQLLNSKTSSMSVAIKLTEKMKEVFPEDPLKGDFALFVYGANH